MNQLNQIILEGIAVDNAVTVEIPSLKILFTVETSRTYKGTDGTVKEVSYFDVEYYGFNVKDLVNQCYEELKPLALNKNLEFNLNCDIPEETEIYADKAEIKRVMINLCGNAVNYTNKDGKIDIFAKTQEGDFIFSVADNGNGIPREDIPHLFMRFSQGTSKKRSTGTGLGLYLSRQIVEAHNGKILLESKVNKGSEFTFILPDCVQNIEVKNG